MYYAAEKDCARFFGYPETDRRAFAAALARWDAAGALRFVEWCKRQRGARGPRVVYRSPATINQRISMLRTFFRFAVADGLMSRNPFERIRPLPGKPRRPTKALPIEKLSAIVAACGSSLDRALLSVLIGGALRRSEAQRLRLEDVSDHDGVTALILRATKNGDEDVVQPLAPWAAEAVSVYVEERQSSGAGPLDPLFVSRYGAGAGVAPIDDRTISRIVKRAAARAGLDPAAIGAHSCRASGVTALLVAGVDRKRVKAFGRFHSYQMLDVYDKRATPLSEHAGLELKL